MLITIFIFDVCVNKFVFGILRYVIVYKKGYQEFQKPYSSVTTKVKGVSLTNLTNSSNPLPLYGGVHVWDSSDFVIPPEVKSRAVISIKFLLVISKVIQPLRSYFNSHVNFLDILIISPQ